MLAAAWVGGAAADKSWMGTQTPITLTRATRTAARVALRRASHEAASMPGTLLPCELIEELVAAACRIAADVHAQRHAPLPAGELEHPVDTSVVGLVVGRRLLPATELEQLAVGLFLQDVGRLALPAAFADKREPLAPDEEELARQHPLLGLGLLRDERIGAGVRAVVRSHHERWDGSGYPDGLIGAETPLLARIAAVAEGFCSSGLDAVRDGARTAYDPDVVEALAEVAEPYSSRSSAAPTMVSASISWWR